MDIFVIITLKNGLELFAQGGVMPLPFVDLTGQRFGRLLIVGYKGRIGHNQYWNYVCDCGNKGSLAKCQLMGGQQYCKKCSDRKRAEDITGRRFHNLTAICFDHTAKRNVYWKFLCDCGEEVIIQKSSVISGKTKRCRKCGCIERKKTRYKNGFTNEIKEKGKKSFYVTWTSMMHRCYRAKDASYENYGGRGIIVCDEWHDYKQFEAWAKQTNPTKDKSLSLDRIDCNGNYEPLNCRWVSDTQQQNNKRTNIFLEYENERHTLAEWARIKNIPRATVMGRYYKNKDPEYIFYKGIHKKKGISLSYKGEVHNIKEWAEKLNMNHNTLTQRHRKNKDPEYVLFKGRYADPMHPKEEYK